MSARRWAGRAFAGLLGCAAYVYWFGLAGLAPTSVDWLATGDLGTTFFGWHFFRFEPWTLPLGLVPGYGTGLDATVFTTDSVPLLALVLKPLSPWLPERLQYLGMWAMASYALNAVFAWAVLSQLTPSRAARIVGTLFLVMAPFIAIRGGWHLSLVAQWPILAAMLLYLRPPRRAALAWGALLTITALINAYMFVTIGAAWAAALWRDVRAGAVPVRRAAGVALFTVAAVTALFALTGLFVGAGHAGASGYGFNQYDLLSLFDSQGASRFTKGFAPSLNLESFHYFGAGAALAIATALVAWIARPVAPPQALRPLLVAALLLLAFAISHRVTVGGMPKLELPLHGAARSLASVFRSSGRMGWLFDYLVLFGSVAFIAARLRPREAAVALAFLLLVNVADISVLRPGVQQARQPKSGPMHDAQEAFTAQLPAQYHRFVAVPLYYLHVDNLHQIWGYGLAGAPRGMGINVAYLARYDAVRYARLHHDGLQAVLEGRIARDAVYYTRNPALAARLAAAPGSVLVAVGEDFLVLPDFPAQAVLPAVARRLDPRQIAPARLDIKFNSSADGRFFLGDGWSYGESWGTWSDGRTAQLVLPALAPRSGAAMRLRMHVVAYSQNGEQPVELRMGTRVLASWRFAPKADQWVEATVPAELARPDEPLLLTFDIGRPQRAIDDPTDQTGDTRELGVALVQLILE